MIKVQPLYAQYGVKVEPVSSEKLGDLDPKEINQLFLSKGLVIFTGFQSGPDEFEKLAEKMPYNKFYGHPGGGDFREFVKPLGTTTKASKGNERIYMHPELGYTPFLPDAVWFLCVQPPEARGETLVCDGNEYLKAIPEKILAPLKEKGIRYVSTYPDRAWHGLIASKEIDKVIAVLKVTKGVADISYNPDTKALFFNYNVPAVTTDRHGLPVFNNSLLLSIQPDIIKYFGNVIRYGDGSKIPLDHLVELDEIAQKVSKPIAWGRGDVALFDNTRFLHGRNSYEGDRVLHVKYGSSPDKFGKAA